MSARAKATMEDLRRVEGKAEIVDGEIVLMSPTGFAPNDAAFQITASLKAHARRTGRGGAVGDNTIFRVVLPHRETFSPDAAYYHGPHPGMEFYEGPPSLAVEVRSKGDYGPAAERALAAKRRDYFAAGTVVIWDVDLLGDDVVRVYRAGDAERPAAIYLRGEDAEAEPAVAGWSMPVDDLFR